MSQKIYFLGVHRRSWHRRCQEWSRGWYSKDLLFSSMVVLWTFGCEMGYTKNWDRWLFSWRCSITCPPNHLHVDLWIDFWGGFFKFLHQMGSHFGVFFCWHFWRCKLMGANVCFRIWIHVTKVAPSTFDVEDAIPLFQPCYEVQCFKSVKIHVLFSKNTCSFFCLEKKSFQLRSRHVSDMRFTALVDFGWTFFSARFFFFIYFPRKINMEPERFFTPGKVTSSEPNHHGFRCHVC